MNISNKYYTLSLSLIISISLVLPFCCHAAMSSGPYSHQQETVLLAAHSPGHQHAVSECGCGHQLSKDFQTSKNVWSSAKVLISPAAFFNDRLELSTFDASLSPSDLFAFLPDDPGPPLYLLHLVFLN